MTSPSESPQQPIEEMNTSLNQFRRSLSSGSIESNDRDSETIQLIDISTFNFEAGEDQFDVFEENDDLHSHSGYIGEQNIYEYLKKKYSSQFNSVSIKWENENGESDLSYDILLNKNGIKHYIEVKSTRTNNQHSFQLSINQIEAILQYKENDSIYRVP